MAMSLAQNLSTKVKEELHIIMQRRRESHLSVGLVPKTSWEQVILEADRLAAEATTVGRLWSAENFSDESLVENIERFSGLIQRVSDVAIQRGTNKRCKAVRKMVAKCISLLKGAVSCYGNSEDRKGAKIPILVNSVWKCLHDLKTPRFRDYGRKQIKSRPRAASPDECDERKRVSFREFIEGLSIPGTDDAARFGACVEKLSRLSVGIETMVQEFVRADINAYDREHAFREMFFAMGEMAETLNQVSGGQQFSEELCQAWTSSTDMMEWIVTEIRSRSMRRFLSLFQQIRF